jgi:nitrogen regulatory protein P-II 1
MKKIEVIIKPFKLEEVKEALQKEKIPRVTVFEVKGAGTQQGKAKQYRGVEYIDDSPEVKLEIFAEDEEADQVTQTIATILRAGDLCDGEIAILPVERVVRVRIGKFP